MSAYRAVWIVCDGAGCQRRTHEAPDPRPTAVESRERAKLHGWHHTRDGRDLCAECWKARER